MINRYICVIWFISLFCINGCSASSNSKEALTDNFTPVCLGLKKHLESGLQIELSDNLEWVESVGRVGTRSSKLAEAFLSEYGEGEDYFCFHKVRGNDQTVIGNLDIAFRKLDLKQATVSCANPNICFSHENSDYRMLIAFVNREGQKNDYKWEAPIY